MRKHWVASILAILASFLLVFVMGGRSAHALADPVTITSAKVTDLNGVSLDGKTITDTNKVRFSFNFITDKNVVANQPYEIALDPIIVYNTGATPIQLVSGNISIGTVDVSSGKAIITLNDNINTLTDIRGDFSFVAGFDKNRIDYTAGNDIQLPGPEKNPHLNFRKATTGGGSGESLLAKTVTYNADDPTIINWSITVNNRGIAVDNAILIDQLEMSQEYVPGSTSINYRNWNRKIIKSTHEDLVFNNQSMTHNFGTLTAADLEQDDAVTSIVIRYQTHITDNGLDNKYPNSATLLDGENSLQSVRTSASWRGQVGGGQGDQVTAFTVIKHWQDDDDADGVRPDAITVHLLADGTEVANKTLTAAMNWQFTFSDLPKYVNAHEIVYTITEDKVAQYETTIVGGEITNTHIVTTPDPGEGEEPEVPDPGEGEEPEVPDPGEGEEPEVPDPGEGEEPEVPTPGVEDRPEVSGLYERHNPQLQRKGFTIIQKSNRIIITPQLPRQSIMELQAHEPQELQRILPATGDDISWRTVLIGGMMTLISLSGYYVVRKHS